MAGRYPLLGVRFLGIVAFVIGGAGCDNRPCTSMAGASALVERAQSLRLDVYDEDVGCDGARIARDAQPISTRSFQSGESLQLDVKPGKRTLQLTAFADAAATQILGTACQVIDFGAGANVCVDLQLVAVTDAGMGDLPCASDSCSCTTDNDCSADRHCGANGKCELGCHAAAGCPAATPQCDVARHACVECRAEQDCGGGKRCSPSGICVDSCDPQKGIGCPSGLACCSGFCIDILTDPLNCGACQKGCFGTTNTCCSGVCTSLNTDSDNCGACGTSCSTAHGARSCALGNCAWACDNGFAHCQNGQNTGCETTTTTLTDCGGCGNRCDTASTVGASCNGTTCVYMSCASADDLDCDKDAPNTNGCETTRLSPTSCGGCGNQCDYVNSALQMCNGTKCVYATCLNSHANCDLSGADTNGCECETGLPLNGCCGTSCATKHSNGIGGNYFDCEPPGTITMQQAMNACQATYPATVNIWNCVVSNCGTGSATAVCADKSHPAYGCPCWSFAGAAAGRVHNTQDCACAVSNDATWN